jgi:hypothetical protein
MKKKKLKIVKKYILCKRTPNEISPYASYDEEHGLTSATITSDCSNEFDTRKEAEDYLLSMVEYSEEFTPEDYTDIFIMEISRIDL